MLTYKDLLLTGPEAVCVLDSELEIRQHNQLLSVLLGYRSRKLTGQHLSSILHDDVLIRRLLSPDTDSGWFQGECALKMSTDRPLLAKFRAGPVADEELFPRQHEITDIIYYPSESRFLPYSMENTSQKKRATASPSLASGYVLIFRESEDARYMSHKRQIGSLQFLLSAVSEHNTEMDDVLRNFVSIFDQNAEVMVLPPDLGEDNVGGAEYRRLLPPSAISAIFQAIRERIAVFHHGLDLWCFFPIHSRSDIHSVACIKFAIPRAYTEMDRNIFSLAGRILGSYTESYTQGDRAASAHPLLEIVLDDIDYPVIVVDRKGAITLCNGAAEKVYGRNKSEMIGRSFGSIAFPANSPILYDDLLNTMIQGNSVHYEETPHIRGDFTELSVNLTAYPYKLDNGVIVGGIFIIRDLREKRRLWDKMMQWEKLSVLGEILSSVANELNNPLTALTGYSHLLLNRRDSGEISNMITTIYEEAKRCGDIVHGVIDLARGDELQQESARVNDVIIAALNLKRRQLRPNNIDVSTNLADGIPGVIADPHDMERLFLRLINYAERRMIEYDGGGRLTVESAFENGKVVIRFIDTGTCVLEDSIAEILDPFFTAGEDEGIGLGLSISCQILRNVGGNIRIENEMGKGNTFIIELPVKMDMAPTVIEHIAESSSFALEAGKRILVVDDEPSIVELLAEILQHMGHVADVAEDGNEAMKKVEAETYDLIIADLRMPSGFTGERLHRFIELKDPDLAQRMIFITGDVINPETRKFLQSAGNMYLEKPFPPESLQEAIEASLGKGASG